MIEMNQKIMMLDCETTNSLDDPLVYDVGYSIFDLTGRVYEEASLVNSDIFKDKSFMETAYYAEKIPNYWREIWSGEREVLDWYQIKQKVFDACKRNGATIIAAHNARFDAKALNLTQRYITTSRYRFFLPWGVTWWDTLKMARAVLKNDPDYKPWCFAHGFVTKNGQAQFTAEVIYKYLTGNLDFVEAHTGLADVQIERDIFLYCMAQDPDLDGRLWADKN